MDPDCFFLINEEYTVVVMIDAFPRRWLWKLSIEAGAEGPMIDVKVSCWGLHQSISFGPDAATDVMNSYNCS